MALRVRPLIDENIDNKKDDCTITFIKNEPQIVIGHDRAFTFDFVFPPETSQEQLYKSSIIPLVDRFTEGYGNDFIISYLRYIKVPLKFLDLAKMLLSLHTGKRQLKMQAKKRF